jgi:hypothetical protein
MQRDTSNFYLVLRKIGLKSKTYRKFFANAVNLFSCNPCS